MMRKLAALSLLVIALILVGTSASDAWSRNRHARVVHGRVFVGVGPAFWWGPPYYPYWYYPPPYYVYEPAPVVVQEPPVYLQPPVQASSSPQAYWHYCLSAKAYYPSVQTCPEAWVKVPPRPE